MTKAFRVTKVFLIIILSIYIAGYLYLIYFSSKNSRYEIAETLQGTEFSQNLFDILINQHPAFAKALMEKSVPFNKRGNYLKGFSLLNKAVEMDPASYLGYRAWLKLVKLKDYTGAIEDLNSLDLLTPGYTDYPWGENIHYLLAISYSGLNNYDKALHQFNLYYDTTKDLTYIQPIAYVYQGIVLAKVGRHQEALAVYDKALLLYGNCTDALFQKGLTYQSLGLAEAAKINFRKCLLLYQKGFKNRDIYNEVYKEIYLQDIISAINALE